MGVEQVQTVAGTRIKTPIAPEAPSAKLVRVPHYPEDTTIPGDSPPHLLLSGVRSGQHVHTPVATTGGSVLQRDRRVKLTHDTYSEPGSVLSSNSSFTNPLEAEKMN